MQTAFNDLKKQAIEDLKNVKKIEDFKILDFMHIHFQFGILQGKSPELIRTELLNNAEQAYKEFFTQMGLPLPPTQEK